MANKFQSLLIILLAVGNLAGADDRLRLQRADVLEYINEGGRPYQLLQGDVIITKKNVTINCDQARYFERTDQGHLVGNITITQDELTLTCDSLHYDSPNDLFQAYGNTHAWDPDYDLVSDTLFYYSELDSGFARGKARLIQESQVINADRLAYWKPPEAEAASYVAENNVVITEEDRIATCGKAIYSKDEEFTILQIDPVVEEDGQTLSGSEIELRYSDEILETIFIPEKAHVVYRNTGFREQSRTVDDSTITYRVPVDFNDDMTGKSLKGYFVDGEMDSLRLEGMATTLYHIFEDSVYQGNNSASGDTIIMNFGTEDLEFIHLIGGARGTYTPDTSNSDIEDPIIYSSDFIDYDLPGEETDLRRNAVINYGDVNLKAGFVNVAWQDNLLKALPKLPADSTAAEIRPTIIEHGKEPMYGESMTYNLENRHGRIMTGRTKADDAYYGGREIRNVDRKTFYIDHSRYTTCDLDTPHFHFEGLKMKIINDDKIVTKPIVLYIAGIPIIGLPFGIFPDQGGRRHSGWIMPSYGESSNRGQYLQGLGYYWAASDYWDSKFLFSLADKQGITFKAINKYRKRYSFSGNFDLGIKQYLDKAGPDIVNILEPGSRTEFDLSWKHTQEMRKNQSFNVNATYQSTADYNQDALELEKRLKQQARSNLTYRKSWPKAKNSFSFNLSSSRDLMVNKKIDSTSVYYQEPTVAGTELNITTSTLPSISFSHGLDYFFKSEGRDKRWYHNISWNYSGSFKNSYRNYYVSEAGADSGDYVWNPDPKDYSDYVFSHSSSISGPQKLFKYINVNPSLGLSSKWVNKTYTIAGLDSSNNSIIKEEVTGLSARTTGNFSLNFNTKFYGMFPIRIGALDMIRHTASPTVGYSYRHDYSEPLFGYDFGYFETITDTAGNELSLDRYSGTLAGGTPKTESQSITFSMNNTFQAKTIRNETEKKIDLFSYNFSTSYNMVAEEYKLAKLSSTLSSDLGSKMKLNLRMTHDFYEYDEEIQGRVNRIRRNDYGIPVPRLTSASMSQSFNFSGKRLIPFTADEDTSTTLPIPEEELDDSEFRQTEENPFEQRNKDQRQAAEGDKLWTASFAFSYSLTNPQMLNESQNFRVNTRLTTNITKKWRVEYSAYIDLLKRNMYNHSVSVKRDLHCWELSLRWTPTGFARGFNLIIQPKSPTLKDLKIEEKGGRYSTGLGF